MTSIKQYAVEYATRVNPATERMIEAMIRRHNGIVYQGLMNNLWDNNPGELDRWADDGGPVQ